MILLFIIYISDVAKEIEKDHAGIKLNGIVISGIFFVDDLVLIGKNREELQRITTKVIKLFQSIGMDINSGKSKIMS